MSLNDSNITKILQTLTDSRNDLSFVPDISKMFANLDTEHIKSNLDTDNYKPCEMLWNKLHLTKEGFLTACCVDYENDLLQMDDNMFYDLNCKLILEN